MRLGWIALQVVNIRDIIMEYVVKDRNGNAFKDNILIFKLLEISFKI